MVHQANREGELSPLGFSAASASEPSVLGVLAAPHF